MSFSSGAGHAILHPVSEPWEKESGDRPGTEQAVQLLLHQQELILNSISEGIHWIDQEGRIIFENPAAARMLGWEVSELIGRPAHRTMHYRRADGSAYAQEECPIYACLRTGGTRHVEDEIFWRKDGTSFPVEYTCSPTRDEKGEVAGAVVVFADITERKLAENVLRASEARFSAAFEHAPIGIALMSPAGRWLKVNRALCDLVGYSEAELLARTFEDITHPKDLAVSRENVRRVLAGEIAFYQLEKCYVHARGNSLTVLLNVSLVRDDQGQPLYFIAQFQDITERKRSEEELRWKTAFLEAQANTSIDGILVVDEQGRKVLQNQRFLDLFKVPLLIAEDKKDEEMLRWVTNSMKNPGLFVEKVVHLYSHPDETSQDEVEKEDGIILERYSAPVIGQDGKNYGRIWTFHDITERKRAEARLRRLVNSNVQGVMFWNTRGEITEANDSFLQIVGYTREDLEAGQLRWDAMTPPEYADLDRRGVEETAAKGVSTPYEKEFLRKDGSRVPILIGAAVFEDKPEEGVCFVLDITERKHAEARMLDLNRQMVDLSRRAGMAEIATSVLHNVGNVLNSANVSLEIATAKVRDLRAANLGRVADLLREHADDLPVFLTEHPQGRQLGGYLSQLAKHFSEEQAAVLGEFKALRTHVDHISEIVARQQSYATACGVIEVLPINELIDDVLSMNAPALDAKGFQVFREFDESIPPLPLDRHKIMQILVNLIRNARHALADAGSAERRLMVRSELENQTRLKITVADNGVGISPENLPRIFEHGFTTRKLGHGFGLHSSAVTAQEMGGSLQVTSAGPGQGAVFILEIPTGGKTA